MSTSFPECVYLGEFDSAKCGNLPAYLPAEQGGFCLHYASGQEHFVNRQVENTVLCLLEDTPTKLLQIDIFDFANRPNFPFLNQLKADNLCQVALNEQATTNRFNELESIIQHRYHSLFNSAETHINQYNARSPRPECFYVLIINTAYFPTSSMSAQRLHNFLTTAYDAGIYIIALHNEALHRQNEYADNNQALQKLLQTLPEVRITEQSLAVDENTLPVQKMAQFDFRFTPADINQSQIIQNLQRQLHTDTDDTDTDFLSVKIGTRPDGNDAYFNMGKKSGNYNAMILGMIGTGKSTLMNNIIMQIGEQYHAGQIQLNLMDYKYGVEFNQFKDHPNVENIFLKSDDIPAGIALLEKLKQDIGERYGLFKGQGVLSIGQYNSQVPENQKIPYILLMIDEFHKLFKGDFHHQEYVNILLEEVMRIGRAAGVHLLLCTQSLKGVNLNSDLKDQINLRLTYVVANDMALGYDNFDSKHTQTILNLQKYQVFVQSQEQSYTAFVDQPHEIEQAIKRLRLSRPTHLQVQAEIIESTTEEENTPIQSFDKPTQDKPTTQTTQSYQEIENPSVQRFQSMENELAENKRKLKELGLFKEEEEDDESSMLNPEWLSNIHKDEE